MAISVALVSLGCSKNLVDGESMLFQLQRDGYKIVQDVACADVVIVNTCGFIEAAQNESIETVLEIAALKKSGQLKSLIVTGCLSQMFQMQMREEMPEVDAVLGTGSYADISEAVRSTLKGKSYCSFNRPEENIVPAGAGRIRTTLPHIAFLKIAEGCNNHCSYCVIPSLRGAFRSRPMEDIVSEARELAADGVKELILIAQDTTSYGMDIYGKLQLPQLLEELCAVEGIVWIRLHYCYPEKITDELLRVMAKQEKIVHYLDIPIQHCSDAILRRMNRKGSRAYLQALFKKIRRAMPDICLRTSLIVGFPGETQEDFSDLCGFIEEIGFDRLGAFCYSPMEGTKAVAMPGQIDEDVKNQRQQIIMQAQSRISLRINEGLIGKTLLVLCEEEEDGQYVGRSYKDSVDIDPKVYFTASRDIQIGSFVKVLITSCEEYDLFGSAVE